MKKKRKSKQSEIDSSLSQKHNQMVDPADDSCATFVFTDEDHTLGNIVRQFLAQK
jgi:DNA-directed RNA polymerase subunit L